MTKTFIYAAIILTAISCKTRVNKNLSKPQSLIEDIVDLAIERKDNNNIELPSIYDSLATRIPDDSSETLMLAESLKKRGFKVINWVRGNSPRTSRFVYLTLQKADCFCEVSKMYYSTASDTLYEMAERISCIDSLNYNKR